MSNILVTGDRGFIAGYLVNKLLKEGHNVFGVDNDWKYGPQIKDFDNHQKYHHFLGDAKNVELLKYLLETYEIDYVVAGAAWIGGISFFHELAYDLLAENERITAATFDACIWAHKHTTSLKKIIVLSSSMVYESTDEYPTRELAIKTSPPPRSTYGFQKLAVEYFCLGAWEQYGLPYTIVRPFNCVGIGEKRALLDKEVKSGNIKLAFSHVVPDIIQKIYKGQDPLIILGSGNQIRHYTAGQDLADGIYKCIFNEKARNDHFNISTPVSTTVLELAESIWKKMKPGIAFRYETSAPFAYDVQKRVPNVQKAKYLLGFETKIMLNDILDEVIPWVCKMCDEGKI